MRIESFEVLPIILLAANILHKYAVIFAKRYNAGKPLPKVPSSNGKTRTPTSLILKEAKAQYAKLR